MTSDYIKARIVVDEDGLARPVRITDPLTPNRRREGRRLARMNAEQALREFRPDSAAGLMARATLEALEVSE